MAKRAKTTTVRIREVASANDPAFPAAHKLLRGAFPRAEMLPQREWRVALREREQGLWSDTNWHLLVAERGRSVIGAASGSYLGNVNVGLIGYVALRAHERSSGVGRRLRRSLERGLERDAQRVTGRPLEAILGEVQADNPWLSHLVRRKGVIALDFPYYQPSLGAKKNPVPLVLYYQPIARPRKFVGAAELRRLLYTMWRRMYRESDPLSHPEFRRMMRSLQGRSRVGQRPLNNR